MKLFKYFSNVLCSHYGWRIINLEWLECLLPWAMSGEGTLSAVRLSELQEINQFSSPCEFLFSRVFFAERAVWHFSISFPSFRVCFSFVLGTKSLLRIFLMRMCVFLMWETIVVDMYEGEREKKKIWFLQRSEMNENWNHGLSTICVRHDSMKSKAKMPLLFSYLSLRGLWLGRKCRFKMKIAMIFTLPPACVHILFICMWEAGMEVPLRSTLDSLGFCDAAEDEFSRKIIAKSNGERL